MGNQPTVQNYCSVQIIPSARPKKYLPFTNLTILVVLIGTASLLMGKLILSVYKRQHLSAESVVSITPSISPLSLPTVTTIGDSSQIMIPPSARPADWKAFTHSESVSFKYPSWLREEYGNPLRTGLGTFNQFSSEDGIFTLMFSSFPNYKEEIGGKLRYRSLADVIKEHSGHTVKQMNIEGHQIIEILPDTTRSTEETVNSSIYFFTTNANNVNFVNSLAFETETADQTKVRLGKETFDQILSTLEFLK